MASGGVIVRGPDGSLYFLRDEVLDACRMEGDHLEQAQTVLETEEGEVEGFAFHGADAPTYAPVKYVQLPTGGDVSRIHSISTIMCPDW